MTNEQLKQRTKEFAVAIIKFCTALPASPAGQVIGRQLLRSATSVAANYRAACRAKSRADFVAKMATVEEEADETAFWLELLEDSKLVSANGTHAFRLEAGELTAIAVASIRTARARSGNPQSALRPPRSP